MGLDHGWPPGRPEERILKIRRSLPMSGQAIAVLAYNNEDFAQFDFPVPEGCYLVYIGLPSHAKGPRFIYKVETPAFQSRPDSAEMRKLVKHVPDYHPEVEDKTFHDPQVRRP
jgi:hypothetical protein